MHMQQHINNIKKINYTFKKNRLNSLYKLQRYCPKLSVPGYSRTLLYIYTYIQLFSLPHPHLPFMINLLFVLLAPPLLSLFPSFMLSPLSLLPTPMLLSLPWILARLLIPSVTQLFFKRSSTSKSQTTFLIGFLTIYRTTLTVLSTMIIHGFSHCLC